MSNGFAEAYKLDVNLEFIKKKSGFTTDKELANALGVSQAQINAVKQNGKIPGVDPFLMNLSRLSGYSINDLLLEDLEDREMTIVARAAVSVDEHTAARPQRVGGQGEMFYSDDVRFGDIILRMGTFGQSKKNPFRDWNVLFVTYATGDFHCGTGDFPYTDLHGKPAVLHHHGYTNFQMLLKKIKELVPNPEQILVTGFSAGAFATSLLTDTVAAAFPKCRECFLWNTRITIIMIPGSKASFHGKPSCQWDRGLLTRPA